MRPDDQSRITGPISGASGRPKDKATSGDGLKSQIDAVTGSLRSWLLTGTRRIPIDPRRRQGVHEGLRQILTEDEERLESSTQEISETMKRQAVVEALNRLPNQESQVIKLAYFGGQTNEEIASATGLPVSSVRRRLREGLRQLQAHLESTGVMDTRTGRRRMAELLFWLTSRLTSRKARTRARAWDFIPSGGGASFVQSAIAPTAATVVLGLAAIAVAGASVAGASSHRAHSTHRAPHAATQAKKVRGSPIAKDKAQAAVVAAVGGATQEEGSATTAAKPSAAPAAGSPSHGFGGIGTAQVARLSVPGTGGTSSLSVNTAGTISNVSGTVTNTVGTVGSALPTPKH